MKAKSARGLAGATRAVALEDLGDRRLAGTVRPEQADHLALPDLEADTTHSLEVVVGLTQVAYLDRAQSAAIIRARARTAYYAAAAPCDQSR